MRILTVVGAVVAFTVTASGSPLLKLGANGSNGEASMSLAPGVFSTNAGARFWRTATHNDPAAGHPQYTFGSQGNTPAKPMAAPGTWTYFNPRQWTSGFFSQGLWMLGDRLYNTCPSSSPGKPSQAEWFGQTNAWTNSLASNINVTDTHDIGFLAEPFESALTVGGNTSWLPTLRQMSYNLANRFVPGPGVVRSWDFAGSHPDSVLVIIDSMMNMPLLERSASKYTQNATLASIVRSHADKVIQHHVRPDGSTFHVCDYSATTGELYLCRTQQGLADNSTWSRGQAWAVHGFTELYELTGNVSYLDTARRAADWFISHLPADSVPFWDFDAPPNPAMTPRDVSAAMVAASGLLSLAQHNTPPPAQGALNNYSSAAVRLLNAAVGQALATPIDWAAASTAAKGANTTITTSPLNADTSQFEAIFMHSTINGHPGTTPGSGGSYDEGLIYADSYFIEAGNKLISQGLASCEGVLATSATGAGNAASSASGLLPPSLGAAAGTVGSLLGALV